MKKTDANDGKCNQQKQTNDSTDDELDELPFGSFRLRLQRAKTNSWLLEVNLGGLKRPPRLWSGETPSSSSPASSGTVPRYRICSCRSHDSAAFPAEGATRGRPQPRAYGPDAGHGHLHSGPFQGLGQGDR